MNNKIIEKELSYKLGGIFFGIQNEFGRFCRERQYADVLENKLKEENIDFKREVPIKIAGRISNFVDFIIEDRVLIDLKAKPFVEKNDYYQMKRYLEIANLELGLIVNFQDKYLKPKRILGNKKFVDSDKFVVLDRSNGFTLIELLVAMSLFVIIVTIAVGSFISAMRTQRALVALMAVNDNASLAIEQMAREIRTGTEFCINTNNSCNTSKLVFTNYKGEQIIYQLGTKTVSSDDNIGILQKGIQQITADNVNVQNLKFIVSGNQSNDNYPPRITILLKVAVPQKGAIGVGGVATNLQTTISARNLD